MFSYTQSNVIFYKARNSLLLLLRTKSFDAVTIKDIADNGGFSRQYFYRFYRDKIDLIYDIVIQDILSATGDFFKPVLSTPALLNEMQKKYSFYRAIITSSFVNECYQIFLDIGKSFIDALLETGIFRRLKNEQEVSLNFYLHGVISYLFSFFMKNKPLDPFSLSDLFCHNIPADLGFLLNEETTVGQILYKIAKTREDSGLKN